MFRILASLTELNIFVPIIPRVRENYPKKEPRL